MAELPRRLRPRISEPLLSTGASFPPAVPKCPKLYPSRLEAGAPAVSLAARGQRLKRNAPFRRFSAMLRLRAVRPCGMLSRSSAERSGVSAANGSPVLRCLCGVPSTVSVRLSAAGPGLFLRPRRSLRRASTALALCRFGELRHARSPGRTPALHPPQSFPKVPCGGSCVMGPGFVLAMHGIASAAQGQRAAENKLCRACSGIRRIGSGLRASASRYARPLGAQRLYFSAPALRLEESACGGSTPRPHRASVPA